MSFLSSLSGNQKLLLGATLASAAGLFLYKKHSSCCSASSNVQPSITIATSGPKVDYSKKSKQEIETEFKQVFQELKKFVLDDIKNNYEVPKENIEYVERVSTTQITPCIYSTHSKSHHHSYISSFLSNIIPISILDTSDSRLQCSSW